MNMTEKSKQHIDSCRFCWMCHHVCPIGNATGQERCTARARALGLSLVNRGALTLEDVADNLYECGFCRACEHFCVTGWQPVMFVKEARLNCALEGKLPPYIQKLVENTLSTGNAYGETELNGELKAAIAKHAAKTDTLLVLGVDARFKAPAAAVNAIKVLEKAGVSFTVLANEPATGAQLDFLIGAADETVQQAKAFAAAAAEFKTAVFFDPADAVMVRHEFKEFGLQFEPAAVTFTAFVAKLVENGSLKLKKSNTVYTYHDPFQLSRELEETNEARQIISACGELKEMLLNRDDTNWAGSLLMAEYEPEVMDKVAKERIRNATAMHYNTMVTASVSEYTRLKSVCPADFTVLSLEELVLAAAE